MQTEVVLCNYMVQLYGGAVIWCSLYACILPGVGNCIPLSRSTQLPENTPILSHSVSASIPGLAVQDTNATKPHVSIK